MDDCKKANQVQMLSALDMVDLSAPPRTEEDWQGLAAEYATAEKSHRRQLLKTRITVGLSSAACFLAAPAIYGGYLNLGFASDMVVAMLCLVGGVLVLFFGEFSQFPRTDRYSNLSPGAFAELTPNDYSQVSALAANHPDIRAWVRTVLCEPRAMRVAEMLSLQHLVEAREFEAKKTAQQRMGTAAMFALMGPPPKEESPEEQCVALEFYTKNPIAAAQDYRNRFNNTTAVA